MPICPHPFINKGWDIVIKNEGSLNANYSGLVLDDCSATWAEVLTTQYTIYSLVYFIPNLIALVMSLRWIFILRSNRLLRGKKESLTTAEFIQYLK